MATSSGSDLEQAIQTLAEAPTLLVACDYDGTLAPIVADPRSALPQPGAVEALQALAALPSTEVAIVSGRALIDLALLSGLAPLLPHETERPSPFTLVGSHGVEFSTEESGPWPPEVRARKDRVRTELDRLTADAPGVILEEKPVSIAVHVRNAPREVAERVLEAVVTGPAQWEGVHALHGKKVLELAVVPLSKGTALTLLRRRSGATRTLFVGDDVTDEAAFAELTPDDVGVKVGSGGEHVTRASYRVADPEAVVALLEALVRARRIHQSSPHSSPLPSLPAENAPPR